VKNPTRILAFLLASAVLSMSISVFVDRTFVSLIALLCTVFAVFAYVRFSCGEKYIKATIAAFFAAIVFCTGALMGNGLNNEIKDTEKYFDENVYAVEGVVNEVIYSELFGSGYVATLEKISGQDSDIKVYISVDFDAELGKYETFSAEGRFSELDEYTKTYRSQGVFGVLNAEKVTPVGFRTPSVIERIKDFGERLALDLKNIIGGREGCVAAALALGYKESLPSSLKLDFRRTGLSHILAVSGFHLSVIVMFLEIILKRLSLKKRCVIIIAFSLFYMVLTGMSPSVCRSAIMMTMYCIARIIGAENDSVTSLMISMFVILLVSPYAVFDAGLWLSCLATLGIVTVIPAFDLSRLDKKHSDKMIVGILKKTLKFLIITTLLNITAQLFTLPVVFITYGGISIVSIIAGFVAIPLSELALILSLLVAIFSFAPFVATSIAFFARFVLKAFISFVGAMSDINDAYISISQPYTKIIITVGVVLTALIIVFRIADKRLVIVVGLLMAASFGTCSLIYGLVYKGNCDVIYRYDSNGESVVFSAHENVIAIDISTGGYSHLLAAASGAEELYGEEIDHLVLTHLHSNHISSINRLSKNIKIRNILLPTAETENDATVIRSLTKLLGDEINICFYNRCSESSLDIEDYSVILPRYIMIDRSTHPIIALEIRNGTHEIAYVGAASNESENEHLRELFALSEVVILGNHGPKHKGPLDISYIAADFVIVGKAENADIENARGEILLMDDYSGSIHIGFRK